MNTCKTKAAALPCKDVEAAQIQYGIQNQCCWSGCSSDKCSHIDGVPYCIEHYDMVLRKRVLEGLFHGVSESGECQNDSLWRNLFARFSTEILQAPESLTKAKIEQRGFQFSADSQCVDFSIVRHPVGREVLQRWRVDLVEEAWTLISETLQASAYPLDTNGRFRCPRCRNVLTVSPGRVKCPFCRLTHLHEHSMW